MNRTVVVVSAVPPSTVMEKDVVMGVTTALPAIMKMANLFGHQRGS